MRTILPALVVLLAATAARAEVWTWTDAKGEAHYTDDPSTIPEADRKAAHPMSGEAGTLNVVHEEGKAQDLDDEDHQADAADPLQERRAKLESEVAELKHQLVNAEREVRKYSAGGRAGASDATVKARAVVEDLQKQLDRKQAELGNVTQQLEHQDQDP